MTDLKYEIRPIHMDEWLPDRCLGGGRPMDPKAVQPEAGCTSLCEFYTKGSREKLVAIYDEAIRRYECCGFVAWLGSRVVGYHNFFSHEMARNVRFFGWGEEDNDKPSTLVHNCITLVRGQYSRRGIGSNLVRHSLAWGKRNGWKRFEVHLVLPDDPEHWDGEQKSCITFWRKLGFTIFRTEGSIPNFSMAVDLDKWNEGNS